ncbi:hypothetical protein GEMRC1_011682 [Eukaryota sp. GEM-RC1]
MQRLLLISALVALAFAHSLTFSDVNRNYTVTEVIEYRRSIREYLDQPVSEDVFNRVLHAGLRAPSAMGRQEIMFTVSRNKKLNKAISDIITEDPSSNIFYDAPIVVYVHSQRLVPGFSDLDGGVAVQNMLLQAKFEGLDSCTIGYLVSNDKHPIIKEKLSIPQDHKLVVGVIFGYGAYDANPGPHILPGRVRKIF